MTTQNTIKYFAYVRKSSEGEERQALSIDSQKDNVAKVFPDLDIVEILEEKHSAFKPYCRPVFADMIRRIKLGEARGIIAWHPDRLSRNEIDASTITYLVRTGIIHDLKFGSYTFDNSPEGIMMLQMALSQSQYFSSKLGKDVKRGLEKKVSLGWLPGVAPEGYLNDTHLDKGLKTISVDKNRSILLRRAFDLILTGAYTAPEVLNTLNNDWHYITRKKRKLGGKSLSRSVWYNILSSPFYAGIIVFNGIESKGKHKPLITLDEYYRIQELLGKRGCKRKPKRHNFTYAGMFKCDVCGCGITAEHKTKYIKSNKQVKAYDYYHCTHKKKDIPCKQGSVEEKEIADNIIQKLKKLEMNPLFLDWALEYLDSQKGIVKKQDKKIADNKINKLKKLETQLSNLTMMRTKDLINDNEYLAEKNTLKKELEKLNKVVDSKKINDELIELTKKKFIFSAYGLRNFIKGDKTKKKEILADLGSNRKIIDKKILISVNKWLLPIYNNAEIFNSKLAGLEPIEFGLNKRKNEALTSLRLTWLRGSDSNRRPID